jgi:hypothetical protein
MDHWQERMFMQMMLENIQWIFNRRGASVIRDVQDFICAEPVDTVDVGGQKRLHRPQQRWPKLGR